MKSKLYSIAVLTVVTACCIGIVMFGNSITYGKINENKISSVRPYLETIFPSADPARFVAIEDIEDATGKISGLYQIGEDGYVYKLTVDGFSGRGSLEFLVGFGADNTVAGYIVTVNNETSGFGTKVSEESFVSSIIGTEIGAEYDTITGVTISSQAIIDGINAAKAHFDANFK